MDVSKPIFSRQRKRVKNKNKTESERQKMQRKRGAKRESSVDEKNQDQTVPSDIIH